MKLLNAVDRANPVGKRNYAILLMVTRLGIRTCDIRELKLLDINWQDNRIDFTQMKTNKPVSLPAGSLWVHKGRSEKLTGEKPVGKGAKQ